MVLCLRIKCFQTDESVYWLYLQFSNELNLLNLRVFRLHKESIGVILFSIIS